MDWDRKIRLGAGLLAIGAVLTSVLLVNLVDVFFFEKLTSNFDFQLKVLFWLLLGSAAITLIGLFLYERGQREKRAIMAELRRRMEAEGLSPDWLFGNESSETEQPSASNP